jgi:ankyrin repeat protein
MPFNMQSIVSFLIPILVQGSDASGWFQAARTGDIDRVMEFIENGVNINQLSEEYFNHSALIFASSAGHFEVCRLLIENGALVDLGHCPALMRAAENGHLAIAQLLIESGASINATDENGETALTYACAQGHYDVVQLLIENGAHVDGFGTMANAAVRGHLGIIQLLLANGAQVDQRNRYEQTALMTAVLNGHLQVVEFLIQSGATVDLVDDMGRSALICAALAHAIISRVTILELLIANGADINHVDVSGGNALMFASQNGHETFARLLIESGANFHNGDRWGRTPLSHSAEMGLVPIVQLLIEMGVDVNHADIRGGTALLRAAESGHVSIAQLLIENGAHVNQSGTMEGSALISASRYRPSICRFLILAGADTRSEHILNRENCVDPTLSPLAMIQSSVTNHEPFSDILIPIHESGISPLQGFISFAFESLKNHVDVFGDSEILSFLQDHKWGTPRVEMVKSIISRLVELQCTELNVLYVVSPFIVSADDATIRRLVVSLEYLTNEIPVLAVSSLNAGDLMALNGRVLNAMIHRSAHWGLRPVVKAIYSIYRRTAELQNAGKHLRVPYEVETLIDTLSGFGSTFESRAMAELASAIQRHRRSLEPITETAQSTMTFTTTGSP